MAGERKYWVGFNLVKGIGPVRLEKLQEHFGSLQAAWEAHPQQLAEAGINAKLSQLLLQVRRSVDLDAVIEGILDAGMQILTWEDPEYPGRLRQIDQSPYVLYLKGRILEQDSWGVGVVGTRRVTAYGRQVTEAVTAVMAEHGITVISGLARGIDGIAHRQALDAGGRTLAILGCGLDQVYPPEHRDLAERIIQQGALISDYPPGTPPDGCNFPPRNRIISGLSRAVLVMEAGIKSGALITATYAAEQGREVFAVPGKVTAQMSRGTNLLIKQGAHPLLSAQDVLDLLDLELVETQRAVKRSLPGNPREAVLYNAVGDEPLHVDELSALTSLPIEEVTATLALMELKGMVRKTFGMKYIAVQECQAAYRIKSSTEAQGNSYA